METSNKHANCLKDISNITRKLVSAFPVNPDDKENADPRSFATNPTKDLLSQPLKHADVPAEQVIQRAESDASSDGFEVNDDLQLDDASSADENEEPSSEQDRTKVLASENHAPAPSPLIMSSLLNSRVLINTSEAENEEDIGASPMFPQQPPMRQERRKLDFSKLDSTSPTTSADNRQQRKLFRRCISMVESSGQKLQLMTSSPEMAASTSRINENQDMTSPLSRPFASFKRPNAPLQPLSQNVDPLPQNPPSKKIRRGFSLKCPKDMEMLSMTNSPQRATSASNLDSPQIAKPMLNLSLSESEANIKKACSLADVPNLTGDRSRALTLPTIPGSGRTAKNLVNVNCHTVADLINGKFNDKISSYRIIDARYEYEYKGGHIRGAENFGAWNEEAFFNEFLPRHLGPKRSVPGADEKAQVIIFHCEFSSARGPALMALLRNR